MKSLWKGGLPASVRKSIAKRAKANAPKTTTAKQKTTVKSSGSRWKGGIPQSIRKASQAKVRANNRKYGTVPPQPPKPKVKIPKFPKKIPKIPKIPKKIPKTTPGRKAKNPNHVKGQHYQYSPNSKVFPAPKGYNAVRMRNGQRGWVKIGGSKFISEDEPGYLLDGVDQACHNHGRYRKMWDSMTPQQRARFVEKSGDIDWDSFWEEHYDPRTGLLGPKGMDIIEELMNYAVNG